MKSRRKWKRQKKWAKRLFPNITSITSSDSFKAGWAKDRHGRRNKGRWWRKRQGPLLLEISVERGSLVLARFGVAMKGDLVWLVILCVKWKPWPGDMHKRRRRTWRNQGARTKRPSTRGIEKWYQAGSSLVLWVEMLSWYSQRVGRCGGSWKN